MTENDMNHTGRGTSMTFRTKQYKLHTKLMCLKILRTKLQETYVQTRITLRRYYKHKTNLAKYENGNLLASTHNILNVWKNYVCHLQYIHGISRM